MSGKRSQGLQPAQLLQPGIEVPIGRAHGAQLQLMIQAPPGFPRKEQRVQADLFLGGEALLDLAEEAAIDQRADPADQAIQGAKGRDFGLMFAQCFQRDIDQVGWIVHDLGGALNRESGDVPNRHAVGEDAQTFANVPIVGVQCAWRHEWRGQRRELERRGAGPGRVRENSRDAGRP